MKTFRSDYPSDCNQRVAVLSLLNLYFLWCCTLAACVGRGQEYSDEDEEFSSGEDASDSEPTLEDRRRKKNIATGNARVPIGHKPLLLFDRKTTPSSNYLKPLKPNSHRDPILNSVFFFSRFRTYSEQQRNLKQKFIALLKRFRVNEDLHSLDNDRETISQKLSGMFDGNISKIRSRSIYSCVPYPYNAGGDMDPADIEDLFEELEDLSDSGPDLDTLSILSTPKPSLRPFFSSSRTNMIHEGLSGL